MLRVRQSLRLRSFALPVALAIWISGGQAAWAEGVVRLSWDTPAGSPGQVVGAKQYGGPGGYDIWLTLSGQSTPVRCFEIWLDLQSARPGCQPAPPLPEAWRFDGEGCAAGQACFEWNSLAGTDPVSVAGRQFTSSISYDPTLGRERIVIAECDAEPLSTPDPTKTYTLARIHFDHTGSCAGEEDSALITLVTAGWVPIDPNGSNGPESYWPSDSPLTLNWNLSNSTQPLCESSLGESKALLGLNSGCCQNDPNMAPCEGAVPAREMSWGRMKAAYR